MAPDSMNTDSNKNDEGIVIDMTDCAEEVTRLVMKISLIWSYIRGEDPSSTDEISIITTIIQPSISGPNGTDIDVLTDQFYDALDEGIPEKKHLELGMRVVSAHIWQVFMSLKDNDKKQAWAHICNANSLLGVIIGLGQGFLVGSEKYMTMREKMEAGRHKENRDIRDQAFEWLDEHFAALDLTMDAAAEQLGTIVPVSFSTRRSYVKLWKKARLSR